MGEPTTLTVRLDSDLKSSVDGAARAQGISTTAYLERALKSAMYPSCPTCGRSSLPGSVPPGFTPQFESWIAEQKRIAVNQPVLLTALENGEQWVYWAKLRDAVPMSDGVLMVKVFVDRSARRGQDLAVPRGNIVGWREDAEGVWFDNQRLLGYRDGNAKVIQQLIDEERAQRQRATIPVNRSGRRMGG
jgi:hypothetical protein